MVLGVWMILAGCQQPTRQFGTWSWSWPKWPTSREDAATTQPAQGEAAATPSGSLLMTSNTFTIRILESTGSPECLQTAWSYLDESSPLSKDWQLLQRNGLRCGVGQFSDWPVVRRQLEQCEMKMRTEVQVALGSFTPVVVLGDAFRAERTIFYYDAEGKLHGKELDHSSLQLLLMTAGRLAEGRIRMIFTPRIVRTGPERDERPVAAGSRTARVEQALENFSLVADVGPREFALIGPTARDLPGFLVGSQLFVQWDQGQRKRVYLLISPLPLDEEKPPPDPKGNPAK